MRHSSNTYFGLTSAIMGLALAGACSTPAEQAAAPAASGAQAPVTRPSVAPVAGDPVWHYDGAEGPDKWGTLSPKFAACGEGQSQSPVDIANTVPGSETMLLKMLFPPAALKIAHHEHVADGINNGHTIQINYEGADTLTIANDQYALVQYHFHNPSEHTIKGQHFPMEMHLVHKAANGKLAVVGVLIEEGAHNAAFDPIWANLPTQKGVETHYQAVTVDVDALLPRDTIVLSLRRIADHAAVLGGRALDRDDDADPVGRRSDPRVHRNHPRQQPADAAAARPQRHHRRRDDGVALKGSPVMIERTRVGMGLAVLALLATSVGAAAQAGAKEEFTAVSVNMNGGRMSVVTMVVERWSPDGDREALLQAFADKGQDEMLKQLMKRPRLRLHPPAEHAGARPALRRAAAAAGRRAPHHPGHRSADRDGRGAKPVAQHGLPVHHDRDPVRQGRRRRRQDVHRHPDLEEQGRHTSRTGDVAESAGPVHRGQGKRTEVMPINRFMRSLLLDCWCRGSAC